MSFAEGLLGRSSSATILEGLAKAVSRLLGENQLTASGGRHTEDCDTGTDDGPESIPIEHIALKRCFTGEETRRYK